MEVSFVASIVLEEVSPQLLCAIKYFYGSFQCMMLCEHLQEPPNEIEQYEI